MKLEDIAKLENLKKDEVFVLWLHPATSKMTTMYCGHMNKPVNGGYWHSHTMTYKIELIKIELIKIELIKIEITKN